MILYFSGTGNSAYVAEQIANKLQDEVINIFDKIRNHDKTSIYSDQPWVVVVPTYAWRIPRIVEEWLMDTSLQNSDEIYFVMTCGENIGNAQTYIHRLCSSKQMVCKGVFSVRMPENYIVLYSCPTTTEAINIINDAQVSIAEIVNTIKHKLSYTQDAITMKDKVCSGILNDMFYPLYVHAKKFYTSDNCNGCGKCVNVCPLSNISLVHYKPLWGKCCTHCMACICGCPSEAIEYGKHTLGLLRYKFPKLSHNKNL